MTPSVQVALLSAPFDWTSVFVPLFAAFFGAAAAFALSWLQETIVERRRRQHLINSSAYAAIITINSLINIKEQFLVRFTNEFLTVQKLISQTNLASHNDVLNKVGGQIHGIFAEIHKQDQTLNGAFVPWEEPQFLTLTSPEDLSFTVEGDSDLIRLLMVARSQLHQIGRKIVARNSVREKKIDGTLVDAREGVVGPNSLLFWYEMLDFRVIILAHVNVALATLDEALKRLERYRKAYFKKRGMLGRWLMGDERWTSYKLVDSRKVFMPKREDHKDVLDGVD